MRIISCEILDFRCIVVNELIGDPVLAVLIAGILFFYYASYTKIGLKTTLWFSVAYFPIVSYFITGGSVVFAIVTFVAAMGLALFHTRLIGNR